MADKMKYHVVVTREGSDWTGEVPGLPGAHTWARNLAALDRHMREVIALVEDLEAGAEPNLVIDWDFTAINDPVLVEASELARRRRDVEEARHDVALRTRELADTLTNQGWSVREAAGVLGISPGRVAQLVSG